jgi:NitT/TauT family transport system substrate-binding protein
MAPTQTRRRFVAGVAAAGATDLLGAPRARAAERALETTAIRLVNDSNICIAPEYVADELLHAEGFTDISYVKAPGDRQVDVLARAGLDFCAFFPSELKA